MAQLSDNIEQFIKDLMHEDARVDLRRNELAGKASALLFG